MSVGSEVRDCATTDGTPAHGTSAAAAGRTITMNVMRKREKMIGFCGRVRKTDTRAESGPIRMAVMSAFHEQTARIGLPGIAKSVHFGRRTRRDNFGPRTRRDNFGRRTRRDNLGRRTRRDNLGRRTRRDNFGRGTRTGHFGLRTRRGRSDPLREKTITIVTLRDRQKTEP
jgi:hypothetical protein